MDSLWKGLGSNYGKTMVNFDNDTTVATPAKDVMKIYLLQCKAYVEDCWRDYSKVYYLGSQGDTSKIKAGLEQLYLVMHPMIERHWIDDDMGLKKAEIRTAIQKASPDDLFNLIIKFNAILDNVQLTKLDTRQLKKWTLEASNLQHGY